MRGRAGCRTRTGVPQRRAAETAAARCAAQWVTGVRGGQLQTLGVQADEWTVYASKSLRVTFERLEAGRKQLIEASHHYGD